MANPLTTADTVPPLYVAEGVSYVRLSDYDALKRELLLAANRPTLANENARLALKVERLTFALTASERRLLHVIDMLRMNGYWAAVMSDEKVIAQIDKDIP